MSSTFVTAFTISAVLLGVVIIALQLVGLARVLQRTPLAKDIPFGEALRRSMAASGVVGRRWAEHPWRMLGITVAIWLGGSVLAGLRWAFYNR
jgi:hypothetical protein